MTSSHSFKELELQSKLNENKYWHFLRLLKWEYNKETNLRKKYLFLLEQKRRFERVYNRNVNENTTNNIAEVSLDELENILSWIEKEIQILQDRIKQEKPFMLAIIKRDVEKIPKYYTEQDIQDELAYMEKTQVLKNPPWFNYTECLTYGKSVYNSIPERIKFYENLILESSREESWDEYKEYRRKMKSEIKKLLSLEKVKAESSKTVMEDEAGEGFSNLKLWKPIHCSVNRIKFIDAFEYLEINGSKLIIFKNHDDLETTVDMHFDFKNEKPKIFNKYKRIKWNVKHTLELCAYWIDMMKRYKIIKEEMDTKKIIRQHFSDKHGNDLDTKKVSASVKYKKNKGVRIDKERAPYNYEYIDEFIHSL